MSVPAVVNIADKLSSFDDCWNPRIIGRFNDSEVRIAKLVGEFIWHAHENTDEFFLVIEGELGIAFRDGEQRFGPGEFVVVPAGTEHKPFADKMCQVLMLDREGEPNTGANPSEMTRVELEAI